MNKTEQRRSVLRDRLVEIAEDVIERDGLNVLTARVLANRAECSLGAIYNVFGDMHAIVETVNIRSFEKMRLFVIGEVSKNAELSAKEQLEEASVAYLNFALQNTNLWNAIMDIEMAPIEDFPKTYLEKTDALFLIVESLLQKIYPTEDMSEVKCMARTMFGAVHGIVVLGTEERLLSVPQEKLDGMVRWLIKRIID